jgi:hypothetical protein
MLDNAKNGFFHPLPIGKRPIWLAPFGLNCSRSELLTGRDVPSSSNLFQEGLGVNRSSSRSPHPGKHSPCNLQSKLLSK